MKRTVLSIAFALSTLTACAQSTTPNCDLTLPPTGQNPWGAVMNQNLLNIDSCVGALQDQFQGTWIDSQSYFKGQMVVYSGAMYVSLQNANLNQNPLTQPEWWTSFFSGLGGGTVNPGTAGALTYYAADGTAVSEAPGFSVVEDGILVGVGFIASSSSTSNPTIMAVSNGADGGSAYFVISVAGMGEYTLGSNAATDAVGLYDTASGHYVWQAALNDDLCGFVSGSDGGCTGATWTLSHDGNLRLNNLTMTSAGSPYGITWPDTQGAGALTNDGDGNLSWDSSSGSATGLWDVTQHGAVADGIELTGCSAPNSSIVLTCGGGEFVSGDVGKLLYVVGAGGTGTNATLRANIASVASGTVVHLSVATTSVVTSSTVHYGTDNTTSLNTSLADACVLGGHPAVYFPPGMYLVQPPNFTNYPVYNLTIPCGNITVFGAPGGASKIETNGQWQMANGQVTRGIGIQTLSDAKNLMIQDLFLDGNGAGNTHNFSEPADTETGDGWDVTHHCIIANGNPVNWEVKDSVCQNYEGEEIAGGSYSGSSIILDGDTILNSNGDGVSIQAQDFTMKNSLVHNVLVNCAEQPLTPITNGTNTYDTDTFDSCSEGLGLVQTSETPSGGTTNVINSTFTNNGVAPNNGGYATATYLVSQFTEGVVGSSSVNYISDTFRDNAGGVNLAAVNGMIGVTANGLIFISNTVCGPAFNLGGTGMQDILIENSHGYATALGISNNVSSGCGGPIYFGAITTLSNVDFVNNIWSGQAYSDYYDWGQACDWSCYTTHAPTWRGNQCQGCNPGVDSGGGKYAWQELTTPSGTLDPFLDFAYVTLAADTGNVATTVDASKSQDGSEFKVTLGPGYTHALTFTSDSNIIIPSGGTITVNSNGSANFVFEGSSGKWKYKW